MRLKTELHGLGIVKLKSLLENGFLKLKAMKRKQEPFREMVGAASAAIQQCFLFPFLGKPHWDAQIRKRGEREERERE